MQCEIQASDTMIVRKDFDSHWKTRTLCGLLNDINAGMYMVRLWAHCEHCRRWVFDNLNAQKLASICRWEVSRAAELWMAMLQSEFIDVQEMDASEAGVQSELFKGVQGCSTGVQSVKNLQNKQKWTGVEQVLNSVEQVFNGVQSVKNGQFEPKIILTVRGWDEHNLGLLTSIENLPNKGRKRDKRQRELGDTASENGCEKGVQNGCLPAGNLQATDRAVDKNSIVSTPISPLEGDEQPEYSVGFLRFWQAYPVKQAKGRAWRYWKRMKLDGIAEKIVASVDAHRGSTKWMQGYVPLPATFLNDRRWEDETLHEVEPQKNSSSESAGFGGGRTGGNGLEDME